MTLLIKGGGKTVYDEDNAIEVPKDETPAYLEWTLWRASLAIDHLVNMPYEVRGFNSIPILCLFRQQVAARAICTVNLRISPF